MSRSLRLILGLLVMTAFPAFPEAPSTDSSTTIVGVLKNVVVDDSDPRKPALLLFILAEPDGHLLHLHAPTAARLPFEIGSRISLRSHLQNGEAWIDQETVRVLSAAKRKASETIATGSRRLAALLINFSNANLGQNCSRSAVESILFSAPDSVSRFYEEASFGQLHFPPDTDGDGQADVLGPFTIDVPATSTQCDVNDVAAKADAAAEAAGVNLGLYQHLVYVVPFESTCGAFGDLGCREPHCRSWIQAFQGSAACQYKSIFAHEIGHNLGMHHAGIDLDADGFFDPSGENGDVSDVMGMCCLTFPQPNAPHKFQLGWFAATPPRIVNVPFGGGPYTYTLSSIEENPATVGSPQILRLANWYVSTRSAVGFDSSIDTYDLKFVGKTSVHRFDPLDPSPNAHTFLTALLGDGGSFADSATGYRVVQLSHTSHSVTVQVHTPGTCVEDSHTACLLGGRFKVQIDWRTATSDGPASVMEFSSVRAESDESAFWTFFSPTNFEIGTKVLDACALNQKIWVFLGGLTDQGFTVRVTDTLTGIPKTYTNPLGQTAVTITDTSAFDCE